MQQMEMPPAAQANASRIVEPEVTRWQPRLNISRVGRLQGLNSGQVHHAAEGKDGRMWMAGPCGLAAYDGARVISFGVAEGLSTQGLRTLALDVVGRLWVGSDAGIDRVENDGTIKQIASGESWPFGPADHVVPMPDGTVYVGTPNGLVCVRDENDFSAVAHPELSRRVVIDMLLTPTGELLVVCAPGHIWVLRGDQWFAISSALHGGIGEITCVAADGAGRIFVGGKRGLVVVSPKEQMLGTTSVNAFDQPVRKLFWREGRLWVAQSRILRVYSEDSGGWHVDAWVDLQSSINHISGDRVGNIWCATDARGCCKITALRYAVVQPVLANAGQIFSVRSGRANTLLIGAENGVFRVLPAEASMHLVLALPDCRVWDLLDDDQGTIWAATHNNGLLHISAGGQLTCRADHPVLEAPCRTLARCSGALLVGTLRGLVAIRDDTIEELTGDDGKSLGYVYVLVEDGDRLWIGTLGNGLWIYSVSTGLRRVVGEGLHPAGNNYAVAVGENGIRVAVQDNRFIQLTGGAAPRLLLETEGTVAGWTALFRSPNLLAVGDSDGLAEYDFPSMALRRKIRCGGIGVGGWEFTSSRALQLDDQSRYWCGLNSGLTVVDCARLNKFVDLPALRLLDIVWVNVVAVRNQNQFVLPSGKWHATVRFYAAWLIDEADLLFRYKLVGFDNDWSSLVQTAEISFSSLPPGQYFLEAQAWSPLCGFGQVSMLAEIRVVAGLWTAIGLTGRLGGIAGAARSFLGGWRNDYLLRSNRELAEIVQQRSSEISRSNKALIEANEKLEELLRIDALTGVANRRAFDEALAREWKRAIRERSTLAVLMVDIDFFKLLNDQYGHAHGDTCLQLVAQCLASTVRDEIDFCARYGGEEFVVLAPGKSGADAMKLAMRLCTAVSALRIHNVRSPIGMVTISIGVAAILPIPAVAGDALVRQADDALYESKRLGRNRATLSREGGQE